MRLHKANLHKTYGRETFTNISRNMICVLEHKCVRLTV
jgi:hypothetical protein